MSVKQNFSIFEKLEIGPIFRNLNGQFCIDTVRGPLQTALTVVVVYNEWPHLDLRSQWANGTKVTSY